MESQKRRTTRIVQAVPLTVTGVDALGRPFQERTSTLIINCHGCRYQSKHYVLKNMWVTFEVPHNEPGRDPRIVRARVSWIQRPRTVRELFQIGVELEVSGNVWGIAFPPGDWFPFPEAGSSRAIPSPAESAGTDRPPAEWATEAQSASPVPEPPEDNVRVLPSPGGDPSLQMARQVARLVVEAKQQVQNTVRETANRAVAAETRPLLAALQAQLKDAAEKSVEAAVAAHIERMQREGIQRMESERAEGVAAMRAEWSRERDRLLADARMQIDSQLVEVERRRSTDFEQKIESQLQVAIENLQSLSGNMGANAGQVRAAIEELRRSSEVAAAGELQRWQQLMDQRTAEAQARFTELEQTAKSLGDRIAAEASTAESGWRGLLEADLAAASRRWNEKIETSLDDAARRFADRVAQNSEASARQLEDQLHQRVGMISSAFSQVTAEAEGTLGTLRASISNEIATGQATISQLQQSLEQFETRKEGIAQIIQTASQELARRGEALLEAQGVEMNRQADSAVAGLAERLQPLLESTGRQTIERLGHELEERLAPQVVRATELMNKLAFDQAQAEKSLQEHQTRLWQASERSVQDSVTHSKEILTQVEKEFAESARNASAKWFNELEAKATETSHATFESLFKSADWYEKKVQTQMQSTLEKGLDQATTGLREKAGELSSQFASELDHYSRSYVEHAQTQMGENARDVAERTSLQIAQAGETAAVTFVERSSQITREQLEQFNAKANSALEQNAARVEAHTVQVRSKLESDARMLVGEFQRVLSQQTQLGLAQGKQELASQVEHGQETLRIEAQTLDRQLRDSQHSFGAQALDEYKQRLENASNSWLLTTVSKLNQQSETLIGQLANSTEERLRSTCNRVIAEMGETLRQRLSGLFVSAPSPTPVKPPETKPDEQ
ncbi:MAG: hypothetical protein JWN92_2683 [Candidatus Acidoferrum typicum]|nr:hypothetical protein [Candidatus Acidoferrum typicum]